MKLCLTVILFTCWLPYNALAQNEAIPFIVATLDRGDYFLIPKSALADSVVGIVYQDKSLRKVPINNRPIEFYWFSICNDGDYKLTVTPEQIFFSSGHENPNPNYLFWVININRGYYENIRRNLLKNPPKHFVDLSKVAQDPHLYRDESIISYRDKFKDLNSIPDNYTTYCTNQINQRLNVYFNLLNSCLSKSQKRLVRPHSDTPKLFSYFKEEIKDWIPQKTKP